jgi:DNA polymerase elongation subunit (family B)
MKLNNICSKGRTIYLFSRDDKGNQIIRKDSTFQPFYYEPDSNGEYRGYDGTPLKKIIANEPNDIKNMRSPKAFSADIKYENNYLIHKVDIIEPCKLKYFFIDIEVLAKEFPEPEEAKYPVSCITIWNSLNKEYKTWWLDDYKRESLLLDSFIDYVKTEAPDIILAWNVDFDYTYLHNRVERFSKKISPVGLSRSGRGTDIFYPGGISIVDYLSLFKKVHMREASYALDYVSQVHLKEKSWGNQVFGELDESVKDKNINDVKRLVLLEEKYNLISYYDEIRRLTKVKWEDLYYNSRLVEMMLLEEAKIQNVILPSKKEDIEKEEFQGAARDSLCTGAKFDIGKFDLTSAYPSMIVSFCLDPQNIQKSNKGAIDVNGVYFKQNPNALLPSIVKKILILKDDLKIEVKKDKSLKFKYDAIKAIVNSTFGVMGNKFFRLYDNRIASSITYLVRDLLSYTRTKLESVGYEVLYFDTDSVFINTKEDISEQLNDWIQEWGREKYTKGHIKLAYDYEGYFTKLFLHSKCHYYGYIYGKEEPEIKGIEIKRSSSSKYEAKFQEQLLEKILNKETREQVLSWIRAEKENIKNSNILDVGFPCKIRNMQYKNIPIFVRAVDNTKILKPKFNVEFGELFYYIFTKSLYNNIDVLAINKDCLNIIEWDKHVDWNKVICRSIVNKTETIFEAMNWDKSGISGIEQNKLF